MLLPSGGRVELRRIGTTNVYESADSSYIQLVDNGSGSLLVRTTDGSQLAYWSINSEYRCTEIKDRNGNYLTIKYDPINGASNLGRMTSIIDTLGRTLNFTYDQNFRLESITQSRNGQTHVLATFGYTAVTIVTNFTVSSGPAPVVLGLPASHIVSVLSQVGLDDGSKYNFDYSSWGQVYNIRYSAADGHQINSITYNLPLNSSTAQTDCPRFTQRQDTAENWNDNNAVTTNFQSDPGGTWNQMVTADGPTYREYSTTDYPDWKRGLVTKTEIYSAASTTVPRKTTVTDWTHETTNVAYQLSPRPAGITVFDAEGNRRRTTVDYTSFGLPSDVFEWGPTGTDAWTLLRRAHTDYELSPAYLSRRIIGLPKQQFLFGPEDNGQKLYSKTSYQYDDTAAGSLQDQGNPVGHDATNFGGAFVQGRGNLTKALRWDVNFESDSGHATVSRVGYNTCGSAIFSRDALNHQTSISYTNAFSSNGIDSTTAPPTLAYPTTITDPDGFSATAKYNYDLGPITRQQDPKGAAQTTEYDSAGRVKKTTNGVNEAYTRFVYPLAQTIINQFTTVQENQGEAYSATIFDGAGRVRATAVDFPDPSSTAHYSGRFTVYDMKGRAIQQTNPTEMTSAWEPTGADLSGWISSSQTYDWKGRPLVTTNQNGTMKKATYGGCGCAGGAVITHTDEGTQVNGDLKKRQQRIYSDALGRTVKTEILNWDGSGQFGTGSDSTVYSTTVNTYSARDQLTLARQYQGTSTSSIYQDTAMTYDGYGRLKTKQTPEQNSSSVTAYDYTPTDALEMVTDARGASQTFSHNDRQLVTGITYSGPAGITATAPVTFTYDSAGNRNAMVDGLGTVVYSYDQLSRLIAEARTFNEPGAPIDGITKTVSYAYSISGALKSITDPAGSSVHYVFDATGRLSTVTGTSFGGVTTYASDARYRAWGAPRHLTYGNAKTLDITYNARMQAATFAVPGVISKTYDYYDDGQLRFSSDLLDHKFDRRYSQDQLGRIKEALSGAEARGESEMTARPYKQNFSFDAFNHLTSRTSMVWNVPYPAINDSFLDNRRIGSIYDVDGNLLSGPESTYTYDQAGNVATVGTFDPASTNSRGVDGDGRQISTTEVTYSEESSSWVTIKKYYARSSALNGEVLTEMDSSGAKLRTFVYAAGTVLAWQQVAGTINQVLWENREPSGATFRTTDMVGNPWSGENAAAPAELDPTGANAGTHAPLITEPPPPEGSGSLVPYPRFSDPSHPGTSYSVDGMPVPVDEFMKEVDSAFHGSLGLAEASARASKRVIGSRVRGVRFGQEFELTYDTNGRMTSQSWGSRDSNRAGSPTVADPIYDNSWNLGVTVVAEDFSELIKTNTAFSDASKAIGKKKGLKKDPCKDFFTRNHTLEEVNEIFKNFWNTLNSDSSSMRAIAGTINSGKGMEARLNLYAPFFADDDTTEAGKLAGYTFHPTRKRYEELFTSLTPRQYRALVVLHELAHALGLVKSDKDSAAQSQKNDEIIFERCGDILEIVAAQ